VTTLFEQLYGFGADTVYLSPAPLYHSAPLRFTMVPCGSVPNAEIEIEIGPGVESVSPPSSGH